MGIKTLHLLTTKLETKTWNQSHITPFDKNNNNQATPRVLGISKKSINKTVISCDLALIDEK